MRDLAYGPRPKELGLHRLINLGKVWVNLGGRIMRIVTKFRLTFLVSTFLISLITQVVADTVLYCQSELATGFMNKGTGWV